MATIFEVCLFIFLPACPALLIYLFLLVCLATASVVAPVIVIVPFKNIYASLQLQRYYFKNVFGNFYIYIYIYIYI